MSTNDTTPSAQTVRADVRRVAEQLGYPPTGSQYEENGRYDLNAVYEHSRMLAVLLDEMGFDLSERPQSIPRHPREVERDLKRVSELLGDESLNTKTYNEHGYFTANTAYEKILSDDYSQTKGQSKWGAVLDAVGVDAGYNPRRGPRRSVTCPTCGETFQHADATGDCDACGAPLSYDEGRLAYFAENETMEALADGPTPQSEIPEHGVPKPMREFVDRIPVPRPTNGGGTTWDGLGQAEDVLYLVGDEREAMRVFIEVNRVFVEDCMSDGQTVSPLSFHWPDERYLLLKQQWFWKELDN